MDDLNCSGEVVEQTLRELEIINRLLGGNSVTISGINELLLGAPVTQPVTIADLGCGGGDMALLIHDWAKARGLHVIITGVDANPSIIRFAIENTKRATNISFVVADVFSAAFAKTSFDIMVATLFMHHFTRNQLVDLLRTMKKQARIGIVINDIHRQFLAYHSIRLLTSLFSRSSMVKFDAPLSVRRAFTKDELIKDRKSVV